MTKAIFSEPEAEKALILDSIKDLVVYHDLDMKILWANREAGASVKEDSMDLAGRNCWEIWQQSKEPCPGCPVLLALKTGQPQVAEISSPDGREWFIRGYPIRNPEGMLVGVAEFCLDITERKRGEKALKKYREELERGVRERTLELAVTNEALEAEIEDRKNAELALRVSEEKYRALVENTSYAIYSLDTRGCFTYANPAIEQYIAPIKAKEVLGVHFGRFIHPDDLPGLMDSFQRSLTEDLGPCEFRVIGGDGSIRYVQTSSRPLRENGRISGITAIMVDITERKRAEDRLRESETRVRRIADNMMDVIVQTDNRGIIQYVSPSVENIIGYTAQEMMGKRIFDLHHEDDREYTITQFQGLIDGKLMGFVEFRHMNADGSYIWIECLGTRLIDETGQSTGAIINCRDITERKLIETKIRESEEKFRVLAETTSCAIAIFQDRRVKYVNSATVRMSGFSREELLSMSLEAAAGQGDPEVKAIIVSAYEQYMSGVPLPGIAEIRLRRKDGKDVWVQTDIGLIEYHGKPAILVSVFDVTERKAAEEELSRVRDELEVRVLERTAELRRSNAALREEILERRQAEIALTETKMQAELYVDLMGHDINNLNQIAAGYLELALETVEFQENQRELLEKPLEALRNSSRLINNVRKLQRIKTHKSHLEIINLDRAVEDAHAQYSGIVKARITISASTARGARVMATELLSDVFSNLIGNAIKHSRGQPVIGISLIEDRNGDEKCYRVTVEDNGPGVPDEYKQIIFNRQQRGQTKAPGSGIGLHLVKTLIDEYGGRVWVEDRVPGDTRQGSRFVVVLPAAD